MKEYSCTKCGSVDIFIDDRGNQKALMCGDCGAWIKWIGKKEISLLKRYLELNKQKVCSSKDKGYSKLNMSDLVKCFEIAKTRNTSWVAVVIKTKGSESSELIINPNINFDNKLEYYKKAYTDNLVLKTYDGIKIIGFTYADTLNDIEDYLFNECKGEFY